MFNIVAIQETGTAEISTIFKMDVIIVVWENNSSIKVNQV